MDDPTLDKRVHTAIGSMHPSYDLSFLRNFHSLYSPWMICDVHYTFDTISKSIGKELMDLITYELYDFG